MNVKYHTDEERKQAIREQNKRHCKDWRERQKVIMKEYKALKEVVEKLKSI